MEVLAEYPNAKIAVAAPTNKAVKVAEKMASAWGLKRSIHTATLASLLGLQITYNSQGLEVLKPSRQDSNTFGFYDLVLADETSMLGPEIYAEIKKAHSRSRTKILFVGDEAQLPPINEEISPVFKDIPKEWTARLTQVMRQKDGNPIGLLIDKTREAIITNARYFYPPDMMKQVRHKPDRSEGVWWYNEEEWIFQIVRAYRSENYKKDGGNHVQVLARTHNKIEDLNARIRKELFGEKAELPFIEEERLIALKPVKQGDWVIMHTATEMQIKSVSSIVLRHSVRHSYQGWELEVVDEDERLFTITVVDPKDKNRWLSDCEKARQDAINKQSSWKNFYALCELSAPVRHAYCITVHASQGGTYRNIFMALGDMMNNKNSLERHKMLYTAETRAQDRLLVGI